MRSLSGFCPSTPVLSSPRPLSPRPYGPTAGNGTDSLPSKVPLGHGRGGNGRHVGRRRAFGAFWPRPSEANRCLRHSLSCSSFLDLGCERRLHDPSSDPACPNTTPVSRFGSHDVTRENRRGFSDTLETGCCLPRWTSFSPITGTISSKYGFGMVLGASSISRLSVLLSSQKLSTLHQHPPRRPCARRHDRRSVPETSRLLLRHGKLPGSAPSGQPAWSLPPPGTGLCERQLLNCNSNLIRHDWDADTREAGWDTLRRGRHVEMGTD